MPYLSVRKPSAEEIETLPWIELTSPVDWDPYSRDFSRREEDLAKGDRYREDEITYRTTASVDSGQKNRQINAVKTKYHRECEVAAVLRGISPALEPGDFVEALGRTAQIGATESKKREFDYTDVIIGRQSRSSHDG